MMVVSRRHFNCTPNEVSIFVAVFLFDAIGANDVRQLARIVEQQRRRN
jgi:hypothetical protein